MAQCSTGIFLGRVWKRIIFHVPAYFSGGREKLFINLCLQGPYVLDQWNPGAGLLRWACKGCDWSWSFIGKAPGMWKIVSVYHKHQQMFVFLTLSTYRSKNRSITALSSIYLLTRFCAVQEHRTEIDARAGTFQAFEQFGQQLLARGHYASPEIKEKLDILEQERTDLEKAWVQRRMMLDQCLELQVLCCISKNKNKSFFRKFVPSWWWAVFMVCLSHALEFFLCSCFIGTVNKLKTGWLPERLS